MLQLADTFEAGIKGVVQSVSSQATEMQASAATLASTAQQATDQATAVAAAVEQASASVQTVASSAEELVVVGAGNRPADGTIVEDRAAGGGRGRAHQHRSSKA